MTPDELSPLEVACGSALGHEHGLAPLRAGRSGRGVRDTLEGEIAAALQRPPCVVSFSGGRDSSAILALAAHVARREGLPLPIPVTLRFPECSDSVEDDWQQMVVDHLELPDWERMTQTAEMDVVGPVAARTLLEHGLLWPFNTYFHVPIMELAAGGSVLTGVGGDELLSERWAWHRENLVVSRRTGMLPLDPLRVAAAVGPHAARVRMLEHRRRHDSPPETPWLRPAARAAIDRILLDAEAGQPLSFRRAVSRSWWPHQARTVGLRSLAAIAADHQLWCSSPFAEAPVLRAAMRSNGWRVYRTRTEAMRALVGDLLPAPLIARRSKATFNGAFFHRHSREFVAEWDGSGVDETIVDASALHQMWQRPGSESDARTYMLLQQLWLRQRRA